jgi:hypothetical protein
MVNGALTIVGLPVYCRTDRFTITDRGRLVHHQCRLEKSGQHEIRPGIVFPKNRGVAVADVDMEYHADILLSGTVDGKLAEFVVRFTHGEVEWIRPYESLAEAYKMWLWAKD